MVLLLSACGPEPTTQPTAAPQPTTAPEPTAAPEPTEAPEATEPPAATEPPTGLSCDEPIKIGFISDLTGGLAIYGIMTERSFMLGMEYATGAPGTDDNVFMVDDCEIEVLVRDDQGSAETTATLARELIDVEDVDMLIGTVSSGSTATLQEIAAENEVVLIVAPAAANDITGVNFNEYTFRTSRENYQDFINLCAYLTSQYATFAQIAPDYTFGWGGASSARDACTFFGGEFVLEDIFAPLDTTEFTPYLEQIYDSGAEAWIVTWAGGGFVPMFQQAEELGLMDDLGIGASFFDNLTMQAIFQPVIGQTSGILYCHQCPDNAINDWLVQETIARYGVPPDLFDADGMNAAILAIEAIKATGGATDAATLIAAMEGLSFEGPKGTIFVRPEDHVAIQDMYIVNLTNLDDPEFKFYDVVDTTRPEPPCLLPEDLVDRCGDLPVGSLSGTE
jgi:branched-chain amino acid transport system substrate-binding protein